MARISSSKGLSASAFVRTLPVTMPAKQAVEAAKKAGYDISVGLVYVARQAGRAKAKKGESKPGPRARRGNGNGGGSVAELKWLALELGIANARAALDDLERGLEALIDG